MYENVKMENMTWQEFAKKKDDVIILPIGATEQHGPHLPTCVDSVLAREFAYRIAEKINGVVAPTISYGYKSKPLSGGGPLFPGTIDLNGATLQALVMDIVDEFVRDGFTKIFILSAHFENEAFIVEAMDLCSAKYGDKVKLLLTNWWDPMSPDVIDKVFDEVPFPGWALEHAAVTETSLMMYFAPELVREDKILDTENASPATYFRYPIEKDIVPETGILASAKSSSAARGKIIVDDVIPNIVKIVKEAFR
ncbi:amidase [Clostridium sulfidigenes]|uniref:Amidase n=1 Tax=Clostridium sulfidigenes TaxID=318464 RepID=A0A084JCZ5_9CLOT|nr:creatininase [Clostridium sulfidigenes]KEZ86829.1 amidase [Clostridium sulfidigenes]